MIIDYLREIDELLKITGTSNYLSAQGQTPINTASFLYAVEALDCFDIR